MKISEIGNLPFSDKIKDKLEWIVNCLKELSEIQYIILFGSYAKGTENARSDLDILVVTEDAISRDVLGEYHSIMDENNVDLVFYKKEDLKKSQLPFAKQLREEGIIIWKRN